MIKKIIGLYICILSGSLFADTITMKNGSVIMGEVISKEKNSLKVKTDFAGTITINWDQVKAFKTDKNFTYILTSEEVNTANNISNDEHGVSFIQKSKNEHGVSVNMDQIAFINPEPWRLKQGYKVTAKANISLKSQHGNTQKDEFELDGEIKFRSQQDRYSINAYLENDTSGKSTTADNWLINGKYDYFVTKKRYYGFELSFERDKFTDLDLRTVLGPHIGHQFYESYDLNLNADIGLVKVYENNIKADNSDYLALNWYVDYDQYFWNKWTQLYHRQKGIWDWEKSNKVTFNSWTGFRFPLRSGIVASAEVEWEYDSKPNNDIDKLDTTYRFKLGYQW
ncbi:MAG: DUF481 domain-containing protein [gamma proteobacterium symbiont of Lucinoma myriamae]|nr:DUF481 domain-containing protein [gamma proteobacterium symbiont of Lucinoma myriamae]MCU7819073.1 DUF481 domain-containing protein [gamma proteobacterium symbiont of Lucinoma myriamae]MCU7831841.1 DUF481 domain-containing protein [gamma proteobacterium symbiont of Lucinoma myriamae]